MKNRCRLHLSSCLESKKPRRLSRLSFFFILVAELAKVSSRAFRWHRGVMLFEVNILDKVQNISRVETDTCIIINPVARKKSNADYFSISIFTDFLHDWVNMVIPVYWAYASNCGIWSFSIKQQSYGAPAITSVCYRKRQSVKNENNKKGGDKLRMATSKIRNESIYQSWSWD